jgi:hypothetical protein
LITLLALGAMACSHPSDPPSSTAEIVGGNPDPTSYPAMGFLVFRLNSGPHAGEIWRPNCGATLIRPNVVITAAHCVVKHEDDERDIVAVGFGDGHTGKTYGVVGSWKDWLSPDFMKDHPSLPFAMADFRHDVAVIELETAVPDITPMPLNTKPLEYGTPATFIGYGRVIPDDLDANDVLANRPDHLDRYPGIRKSIDLEVVEEREVILSAPRATADRAAGSTCQGDSGGTLILADGSVTGALTSGLGDYDETDLSDATACDLRLGARFSNFNFPPNATFIARRLAAIGGAR